MTRSRRSNNQPFWSDFLEHFFDRVETLLWSDVLLSHSKIQGFLERVEDSFNLKTHAARGCYMPATHSTNSDDAYFHTNLIPWYF
jgi:hypothetical protein